MEGELADLADWWESFQHAEQGERDELLRPDESPKKKRRPRSRGRKRGAGENSGGATNEPATSSGDS
jgi:hypothetical protein